MPNLESTSSATRVAMMRRLARSMLGMVVLGLAACAAQQDVTVQRETNQIFPATTLVAVLQALPAGAYERIAVLDVQGPPGTPTAQLLAQLQAKAAALGANAIVVEDLSTKQGGTLQYNPSGGAFTTSPTIIVPRLRAVAIRQPPESTR